VHEETLEIFNLAINLNPADAAALNGRGNMLHELKRYDDTLVSMAGQSVGHAGRRGWMRRNGEMPVGSGS
jgi:hypothetical protein